MSETITWHLAQFLKKLPLLLRGWGLILIFGLLSACGGGSESSGLLDDTFKQSTGDTGGTGTDDNTITNVTAFLTGPTLIPAGGSTTLTLVTFEADSNADLGSLVTEPDVTFAATVTGSAKITAPSKTDNRGQAVITVSHPGTANVLLTIQGTDRYKGGFNVMLYFGATVSANLTSSEQVPADGLSSATLLVSARDGSGGPIANAPVVLSFPPQSFAVASVETGYISADGSYITNSQGLFEALITDTIPQKVTVTPSVGTLAGNTLSMVFTAVGGKETVVVATPRTIDLRVVENNKLADGKESAILTIVARDSSGTPIRDVPIHISSDSSTTVLTLADGSSSGIDEVVGSTGSEGLLTVHVTNTADERVMISADTNVSDDAGNTTEISNTQIIEFIAKETAAEQEKTIKSITLNVLNNNQPADGKSEVRLIGRVLDNTNQPVKEVTVSIVPQGGSAIFKNSAQTDVNGYFSTTFTDDRTDNFSVTAVAGNVTSNAVSINFTAVPTETPAGEELPPLPSSVTLTVSPEKREIDDGTGKNFITVTAVVRNNTNIPMSGVTVVMDASSSTALFRGTTTEETGNTATKKTGDNGVATFRVTNTVEGSFSLIATAFVLNSKEEPVGQVSSQAVVGFFKPSVEMINLTVTAINSPQIANGEDKITLQIVARDSQQRPVGGVPIILRFASAAIANPITGKTKEENGLFETTFTSHRATKKFEVTVAVEGMSGNEQKVDLEFTAVPSELTTTPISSVSLEAIPSTQPADDASKVSLLVIPRNKEGTPVTGVTIEFATDSTDLPVIEGDITNGLGEFRTTVTSKVAGVFNITAFAKVKQGETEVSLKSNTVPVTFTPAVTPTAEKLKVYAVNDGQIAGISDIVVQIYATDNQERPIKDVPIAIDVKSSAGIVDLPKVNPSLGVTNEKGLLETKISSTVPGEVTVTVTAVGTTLTHPPIKVTFLPRAEVAELKAQAVNDGQVAGGTPITVSVVARDAGGRAVAGVPIVVGFPTSTVAVANPASGKTDEAGYFETKISSSVPGDVTVNISVAGTTLAYPPFNIKFAPPTGGVTVTSVELLVLNAPQPGDTVSKINVIVTPRDNQGNAMAGVDVELIASAEGNVNLSDIKIDNSTGVTNSLGEFRTGIATTQALTKVLTVLLTPIAKPKEGAAVTGQAVPITFTPKEIPVPDTLTLNVLGNNVATGESLELVILARKGGSPLGNVPVSLLVEPSDTPPDITGSVIFSEGFEGLTDGKSGVFRAKITNNRPGSIKVTARAKPAGPNSNTVEITFVSGATDTVKEVSELKLISSSPQLNSQQGNSEGVAITAIVRNKDNNLVAGAVVSFSSCVVNDADQCVDGDAGELQLTAVTDGATQTPGVTDDSGRAQAKLTTQGNADNRRIKVTASTPTTTGEIKQDSIIITVVGTTIAVTGPTSVIINTTAVFTVTLADSNNRGIEGERITMTSALGNSFDDSSPVTSALGQAKVTLTANKAGKDTITASKVGAGESKLEVTISDDNFQVTASPPEQGLCPNLADNEDLNNNRLMDPGEDLNGNGKLDLGCQVGLGQEQGFKVHWDKGGNPQPNKNIILVTTRGQLGSNSILTDFEGNALFTIRSDNDSGDAIVTVRAEETGGPSRQFNVKFVATNPTSINVQANPAVINTNPVGTDLEQSEILAVVRDVKNNLVYGRRVNFVLSDVSGGRLTLGSAITDDFGQAKTTYIAGPSSSAANGVTVKATVADTSPEVSSTVSFTVAQRSLFITIGSGNVLEKDSEGRRYKVHHTLLVTDSNGTPVGDAEVILSIYPQFYTKAGFDMTDPENPVIIDQVSCGNEDLNRNGILDPGEDINKNGALEPGNVLTVSSLKLKTSAGGADSSVPKGFADFDVIYAIQYANWVTAEITARAAVSGSEGSDILLFDAVCSAEDVKAKTCPQLSPFGFGKCEESF